MSIFAKSSLAPVSRTPESSKIALLLAALIVVMVVAQLFTFDTFIELVESFSLPLGDTLAGAVAPVLVAAELFALPFLLRMPLSIAFRWVSLGCVWLVPLIWFGITTWLASTYQPVETVGFLGTIGTLTPGWWAVGVSFSLGILAAWASWGLWPGTLRGQKAKK